MKTPSMTTSSPEAPEISASTGSPSGVSPPRVLRGAVSPQVAIELRSFASPIPAIAPHRSPMGSAKSDHDGLEGNSNAAPSIPVPDAESDGPGDSPVDSSGPLIRRTSSCPGSPTNTGASPPTTSNEAPNHDPAGPRHSTSPGSPIARS